MLQIKLNKIKLVLFTNIHNIKKENKLDTVKKSFMKE
jgi:hypothetical protein